MNNISFKIVTSSEELDGAFAVRRNVFIDEQNISENEEYDGRGKKMKVRNMAPS